MAKKVNIITKTALSEAQERLIGERDGTVIEKGATLNEDFLVSN